MADRYRVLVGLSYVPMGGEAEVRREPGEELSDLPIEAARALLEAGAIAAAEPDLVIGVEEVAGEAPAGRPRSKRKE